MPIAKERNWVTQPHSRPCLQSLEDSRVKEGKLEAFRQMSVEVFTMMEASKPGTFLHYGYTDKDGSELSFVHFFPDADAMDAHFVGAGDRAGSAAEYIESYQFEIYGSASEHANGMLSQAPKRRFH